MCIKSGCVLCGQVFQAPQHEQNYNLQDTKYFLKVSLFQNFCFYIFCSKIFDNLRCIVNFQESFIYICGNPWFYSRYHFVVIFMKFFLEHIMLKTWWMIWKCSIKLLVVMAKEFLLFLLTMISKKKVFLSISTIFCPQGRYVHILIFGFLLTDFREMVS